MRGKPRWLKVKVNRSADRETVRRTLREGRLSTVCEAAGCPNRNECWAAGTATFLLLGDTCTRNCRFCDVNSGEPNPPASDESREVARAVDKLELDYVVLTSVTRDDLSDGGADHWARTIRTVRSENPNVEIEVLVPDFNGDEAALELIFESNPGVFNHNVETVPRLYSEVRPEASYSRSLAVLERAAERGFKTKSGLMLGLGERRAEIYGVLEDLRERGVRYLTLGQYLQPSAANLSVKRWVRPARFEEWKSIATELGFNHVEAAPLVRSSYHAAEQLESAAG